MSCLRLGTFCRNLLAYHQSIRRRCGRGRSGVGLCLQLLSQLFRILALLLQLRFVVGIVVVSGGGGCRQRRLGGGRQQSRMQVLLLLLV